jgi:hypothetical protein
MSLGDSDSERRLSNAVSRHHGRMVASLFPFDHDAAAIMAADFEHTPSTGITVRAGGDCYLLNIGGFTMPERHPVFDIDAFIEVRRMSWEGINRLSCS